MIRIGILTTVTGGYTRYLEPLWTSITDKFLPSYPKQLFVFTDHGDVTPARDRTIIRIGRRGFPGDTLYRYHHYARAIPMIRSLGIDVLYAMDVDMSIFAPIGPEVLPTNRHPFVMVAHPGYENRKAPAARLGTPETNPDSAAYIAGSELREYYVAGAFVGGFTNHFADLARSIRDQIDHDDRNDIMAVWHDESHLNRLYVSRRREVKVLPSIYCFPETSRVSGCGPKILALEKQHSSIRDKALHVSVLIPLYNGVEFLSECLASVRRQSYPYYEVLIGVNGHGPSSAVFRQAKEKENEHVRVARYDTRGAAMTCNRMKEDAEHDLLCILDVDDKWAAGKLEAQICTYRRYFVDVVGTHCRYFGDLSDTPAIPSGWIDPVCFLEMNPIINSSVMMQRHQVHWRDHFVYDYEMWLRMVFEDHRVFYNIGQPLCYHRIHRSSFFNNRNDGDATKLRELWRRRVSGSHNLGGFHAA